MALFSEIAQAMHLLYGANINNEKIGDETFLEKENDDSSVEDYETFCETLNRSMYGYEEEQPLSSNSSGNEDLDLIIERKSKEELNLPAKLENLNSGGDDDVDAKENKDPSKAACSKTVPLEMKDTTPCEHLQEETKKKKKKKSSNERREDQKEKHPMLNPCSCKKKCSERISEELRKKIHHQYWSHDYNQRLEWLSSKRVPVPIKRRKVNSKNMRERNVSYEYFFLNENDCKEVICQEFFKNTLGYKSHKFLQILADKCKEGDNPIPDRRGKNAPPNKTLQRDIEDLDAHIMSYDPKISHYRRSHAPNRLYLPNSLSIKKMHDSYKADGGKLTYEMYRTRVKGKNIVFTKLGNEECEECLEFENHSCQNEENVAENIIDDIILVIENIKTLESISQQQSSFCKSCNDHESHLIAAKKCRKEYQKDAKMENTESVKYFSVDLEKVIMLPRFPGVKVVVFTKRIIAYNLTFAPLGTWKDKSGMNKTPVAVTWHEGEGGRSATEIASGYTFFIESNRDVKHFIFWADNCSSQNKNWYLFTLLCILVNSKMVNAESITLKYFEAGHTFMSADSYHHLVEKAMSEMKNVQDWKEFLDCLNKHGEALEMKSVNFFDIPRGLSEKSKRTKDKPYLDKIYSAKFIRGSSKIFWKENIDENQFRSSEFLVMKIAKNLSSMRSKFPLLYPAGSRGIQEDRLNDIKSKLCPLMKTSRREFWFNLKTTENKNLI